MARVMLCPGSVRMSRAAPPEVSGPAARDGTEAHELLDFALQNQMRDAREASAASLAFGARDNTNDDDARLVAVQYALDHVWDIMDSYEDAELHCEVEFILDSLADDDVGGYCDACIYVPSLRLLYIIDYKHGVVYVEVRENKQALFYATGAIQGKFLLAADTIICQIVQPNTFGEKARTYVTTDKRLTDFAVEVDEAIIASKQPDAPIIPGRQQCEWCPARAICPEYEKQAVQVANQNFSTVRHVTPSMLPDPAQLDGDRLAEIMANADILRDWLKAVEGAAFDALMNRADAVPGFKLVEAQSRRRWYGAPDEVAAQLEALTGLPEDKVYPRHLMTITDAERAVKAAYTKGLTKKADKKLATERANVTLAYLTIKDTSGNLTLVPDSDKRPSASQRDTSMTFNSVVLPAPRT